jgi:hypothetical protein
MDTGTDTGYVVFVRHDHPSLEAPEAVEQPVQACASYEEARHVQRAIHNSHHDCVIRFLGEVGGGD